jgi:chromosome segregation ATPase
LHNKEKKDEIELSMTIKTSEKTSTIELIKITIIQIFGETPVLIIKLTNSNNPLFLYTLELSEIEYQQFKSEQNLLINFKNFPEFILKMLNICKNNKENKYSCSLNISGGENNNSSSDQGFGILSIEEITEYRKLNHLSLKLKMADEENLKRQLKTFIKEYKDNYDSLLQNYDEISKKYENYQKENENYREKYQKLKIEHKNIIDNMLNEKKKEINEIRENYDLETKKQFELLEIEKNNTIKKLENKLSQLEKNLKDIMKSNSQLETTKKDLEDKISSSNSELNVYKSEINNLHQENSELNQKNINNEKKVVELNYRNENLLKQIE